MIKYRIFLYEIKRAIFSKAYLFLLLLICGYSAFTIKTSIIYGYADTAPFSEWSFMSYLIRIAPFLFTILLFYISRMYSPYEQNIKKITSSMPFSNSVYYMIKLSVTTVAYLLAAIVAVTSCFGFYGLLLGFTDFGSLALCIVLIILPQLLIIQGVGIWACRIHYSVAFILIAFLFFISMVSFDLPFYLDLLGGSIMDIPNNTIPVNGEIAFRVPSGYYVSRLSIGILGLGLITAGCIRRYSVKSQ